MSFSNFMERKILDFIWSNTAMTVSGTYFVGLATATIATADTGITVVEPPTTSGGNPTAYARVSFTNNATNWPAATVVNLIGQKQNAVAINFPQCSTNWGTVTYFFMADTSAVATGSIVGFGALTTSKTISSGDTASFAINAVTITLS